MKILLINCPNRLSRVPEFFPYGLALISSVLKSRGYSVDIYDLNLNRSDTDFSIFLKDNSEYDIIGISGLITTYSFQINLAKILRNYFANALILSGGGLASAVPEFLLATSEFDISVVGEGEIVLLNIIDAFRFNSGFANVKGIAWKNKKDGIVSLNQYASPIKNLDSIPFPDWENANLKKYFKYSGFGYKGISASKLLRRADLSTTRGCPYHCSFCSNVFRRDEIRSRSIDNVINEISLLIDRYCIDSVDFLDENFCYSRERVIELCQKIIESNFQIKWGTAARVDSVDKELLILMKEAGCVFILYGFETGSQQILDKMSKRITVEQSWQTFTLTENIGIDARGNLIIGHPGETQDTLRESFEFQKKRYNFLLKKYKPRINETDISDEMAKRFSTVSLCTPYPGSNIYTEYKDKIGDLGDFLISISMSDANKFVVNLTDMSVDELLFYQKLLTSPEKWNS